VPGPLLARERRRRPQDVDHVADVGLHLSFNSGVGQHLAIAEMAVARVVRANIYAAKPGDRLGRSPPPSFWAYKPAPSIFYAWPALKFNRRGAG